MGLRLSKHAGDEDSAPLSVALMGGHSNNPEEEVEYYVHELASHETLSPDAVHIVTPPPLRNLPANFNGGGSAFISPEHEVQSCVIQVGNEPVANEVAEQGTAPIAPHGNIEQMKGSENEGHGNQLKFGATFAYWSGGLSFAASIAIISESVGTNSFGSGTRRELNASATCMACAFILSVLLLVVARVRPTRIIPPGALGRATMALIGYLLVKPIILWLLLLYCTAASAMARVHL